MSNSAISHEPLGFREDCELRLARSTPYSSGFTLIETVIVIALSVSMLTALSVLYVNFSSLYAYEYTLTAASSEAAASMTALDAAILPAQGVVSSHTFSGTELSTSSTTLVLVLPSITANGDILAGSYDYVGFATTSAGLSVYTDAAGGSARTTGAKLLTNRIPSLSFTYDSPSPGGATRISITLVLETPTKKGIVNVRRSGLLYLRNKP